MHRDVSSFVLSCEAVLMYFCTNVDITFQKCIWCCISVLCNLYYFYWSMRTLNQVDHDLNCTESAHKVTQVSWGLISLLNHWKCLVSPKLLFPLKFCILIFLSVCLLYLRSNFGEENSFLPPYSYIAISFMLKFINESCCILTILSHPKSCLNKVC